MCACCELHSAFYFTVAVKTYGVIVTRLGLVNENGVMHPKCMPMVDLIVGILSKLMVSRRWNDVLEDAQGIQAKLFFLCCAVSSSIVTHIC